ncbi:DUF3592 domain-containing protein [Streptomyces oryzae]|uniref:DUF3592 domain-containing protein n=1 Tax=Streptomyces oryzae TaxID=1434886 RepID=A0ABS3XK17_9ACTN|nr:DUF3592 domain-containing protein [Streptomyces oryzae]MBO8195654.1 DUF3592 domain-containing protein [Streptomyces oryzae]
MRQVIEQIIEQLLPRSVAVWVFPAFLLLIGAYLCRQALRAALRTRGLRRHGVAAAGTVVSLERPENQQLESRLCYPVITWDTADGRRMKKTSPLAVRREKAPQPGSGITVYYLPSDPAQWSTYGGGSTVQWVAAAAGAALCVWGIATGLQLAL